MTVCTLQIMFTAVFGGSHDIAAACTMYFPRKNTDIPRIKRFCSLSNQILYPVPEFSVNNRFVRSLNAIPCVLGSWLILFGLIRDTAVFPLYHVPNIDFIDKHIGDCEISPECTVFCFRLLVAKSMQALVFGWVWDAPVIQYSGDCSLAVSLHK